MPERPATCPAARASFGLGLAVLLLAGSAAAALSGDGEDGDVTPDPGLIKSFEAIREAFRTGRTTPIVPILPASGKMYLAVKAIAPEAGFYSRDQFEALLSQAFSTLETLRFHVNMELARRGGEGRSIILCPAAWTYVNRGARSDMTLRFLLARDQDRWTLSEIREAR